MEILTFEGHGVCAHTPAAPTDLHSYAPGLLSSTRVRHTSPSDVDLLASASQYAAAVPNPSPVQKIGILRLATLYTHAIVDGSTAPSRAISSNRSFREQLALGLCGGAGRVPAACTYIFYSLS
eukprot:SAG31_NODE_4881_length_2884_cov_96.968425_2_plen_123_part_00